MYDMYIEYYQMQNWPIIGIYNCFSRYEITVTGLAAPVSNNLWLISEFPRGTVISTTIESRKCEKVKVLPLYEMRFESLLDPKAGWPGCYKNVWHCEGLSMALLQLKDPLELIGLFLPGSGFLSCWNMT